MVYLFIISAFQNKVTATGLTAHPVAVFFKYLKNVLKNYLSNIDKGLLILYNKVTSRIGGQYYGRNEAGQVRQDCGEPDK